MKNFKPLLDSFKLNKKLPIIIATSGGVDSMVLLDLLQKNDYIPIIIHFNHNTRPSNIDDENLIIEYAKKNTLLHYIFSINVTSGNFQAEARNMRYKKLKSVAKIHKTPYIATAHHLDDLAETILIKMNRGSNLYGYSGIQPLYKDGEFTLIKPLLYTSKDEIYEYANIHSISFNTDETNATNNYLRNRYRHNIIPIMKQENPKFLDRMLDFHIKLSDSFIYIKKIASSYIIEDTIDVAIFSILDKALQGEIVAILLERKQINFTYETLKKIILFLLNDKPNISYNLENSYIFVKAYNKAYITTEISDLTFKTCLNENEILLPNMKKITFSNGKVNNTNLALKICYNKISLPLWARTREPGDILSFDFGKKKLKDFLIDKKIPLIDRKNLWLITDNDNTILWVSGLYTNKTLGNENQINIYIGDKK